MFHKLHNACTTNTVAPLRTLGPAKGIGSALPTNFTRLPVLLVTFLMFGSPVIAQSGRSSFATVRFGEQVQADLPRNWTYADKRLASDLNTASEAVAQNLGLPVNQGDNMVLVAGNALDGQGKTRATLRISVRVAKTATQAQIQEFARQPASEIQAALRPSAEEGIKAMRQMPGVVSYAVRWVKMDSNEYITCMQSSYEGVLSTGPRISDTWVCPVGNSTVKLTSHLV